MKSLNQTTVILILVIIVLILVSITMGLVVSLLFRVENMRESITESRSTRDSQNQPSTPYPLVDTVVTTKQQYLQIVDLYITRRDNPDGTFDIEITIDVKNTGDRIIIVKLIEMPNANWTSPEIGVAIRPGEIKSFTFKILDDKPLVEVIGGREYRWGEIWRKGNEYTVIVRYIVQGDPQELTVIQKSIVT